MSIHPLSKAFTLLRVVGGDPSRYVHAEHVCRSDSVSVVKCNGIAQSHIVIADTTL